MDFPEVTRLFQRPEPAKILAFGSSNTQRRVSGMHWFDCFELAVANTFSPIHHFLNTGIGGDTSTGLLNRFDRDAGFFNPDLVFVTIGGNDSAPGNGIDHRTFVNNLKELKRRFDKLGCVTVFQTYYAPDRELVDNQHYSPFVDFMEVVRRVSRETGALLIDHLARWEPFRREYNTDYKALMLDPFHINHTGNQIMGLYINERFGIQINDIDSPYWDDARRLHDMMSRPAGE